MRRKVPLEKAPRKFKDLLLKLLQAKVILKGILKAYSPPPPPSKKKTFFDGFNSCFLNDDIVIIRSEQMARWTFSFPN